MSETERGIQPKSGYYLYSRAKVRRKQQRRFDRLCGPVTVTRIPPAQVADGQGDASPETQRLR